MVPRSFVGMKFWRLIVAITPPPPLATLIKSMVTIKKMTQTNILVIAYYTNTRNERQTILSHRWFRAQRYYVHKTWGVFYFFATHDAARFLRKVKDNFLASSRRCLVAMSTVSTVMFVNKHEACLLLLFLREWTIKYNYNTIRVNTKFIQKYKKFPSPPTPRCGRR